MSEEAARLLEDYLLEFGTRLTTGYDVTRLILAEIPDVILWTLADERLLDDRTAAQAAAERGEDARVEVRGKVPVEHRELFDELVAAYAACDADSSLPYAALADAPVIGDESESYRCELGLATIARFGNDVLILRVQHRKDVYRG